MRDERSIRFESESEENDSRNLVSVFTVARACQFSRSRGKTWKSQGKTAAKKLNLSRWEATLDLGPLSLSPLFHLFLSRYFHSDHEVYLSRCAAKVRYF